MIESSKSIFLVGIKGTAMANLAVILKQMGKTVSGSDKSEVFITDEILSKHGIEVITSFEASALPTNIDLVIYSGANQGVDNPQVVAAKQKGTKVAPQAQILGELLKQSVHPLAVAGCHGKTTTSGMLAYALQQLGVEPSYMVGVPSFNQMEGGAFQKNEYFVIEADEYAVNPPRDKTPKFHYLYPQYAIITNIDYDHPDVYANLDQTKDAFRKFIKNVAQHKDHKLFLCADDENILNVISGIDHSNYKTYGFNEGSDIKIMGVHYDEQHSYFSVLQDKNNLGEFTISLFGEKNISNATGVVSLLLHLGFESEKIKKAISTFAGAKRRFEQVEYKNNVYLFDDYAHHPQEIAATIQAAKKRFPKRRIIILFQPHTFSRTQQLKSEFISALSLSDYSVIAPIFASAREKQSENEISSSDLEALAREQGIGYIYGTSDNNQLLSKLRELIKPGDVVFTMGAGDIYKLKNDIISLINNLAD